MADENERRIAERLFEARRTCIAIPPVREELSAGGVSAAYAQEIRKDEISVTLQPGEGAEVKLAMSKGAKANFTWTATDKVNFDLHGDGGGESTSYEKGRGVAEDDGVLEAAFDGNHGWFWRNRTSVPVTVTLKTGGAYTDIKRVM